MKCRKSKCYALMAYAPEGTSIHDHFVDEATAIVLF